MIADLPNIEDIDHIPVEVMRQAWADSGLTFTAASKEMGWGKDGERLKRVLGFKTARGQQRTHVDYNTATQMVRCWRLDPVDYGI